MQTIANEIGCDKDLALALFETGIYEARILCSKICEPACISSEQMDRWALAFENWEICDSFSMKVFAKSDHGLKKAFEWSSRDEEYVKRAGFVIMAAYGFADKEAANEVFEKFFPVIEREAKDDRVYVKKAVNWALRNIGKRNIDINKKAITVAKRILTQNTDCAKWIAKNAIAELKRSDVHILDYPRKIYRPKK